MIDKLALKNQKPEVDTTGMKVTSSQMDLLSRLLDVADFRHRVIAENVANVNTPGYHAMTVNFEDAFQKALKSRDGKALKIEPRIAEGEGALQTRVDGNTVDVDMEMAQLAKNSILYRTYTQILTHQVGLMRSAITGR